MTPSSWQDSLVKDPLLIWGESNEERFMLVQKSGGSGVSWSLSLFGVVRFRLHLPYWVCAQ